MAKTTEERFLEKVKKTDTGCWEWEGYKMRLGYGMVSYCGHKTTAHRVSYTLFVGPIPNDLEIDHLCRNPSCVNPNHLEAVSHLINMQRRILTPKSECKHGHSLGDAYLIKTAKRQYRKCRVCRKLLDFRRHHKTEVVE